MDYLQLFDGHKYNQLALISQHELGIHLAGLLYIPGQDFGEYSKNRVDYTQALLIIMA
jgi:hypothetical protein